MVAGDDLRAAQKQKQRQESSIKTESNDAGLLTDNTPSGGPRRPVQEESNGGRAPDAAW